MPTGRRRDLSVWHGIAQDALVMNRRPALCGRHDRGSQLAPSAATDWLVPGGGGRPHREGSTEGLPAAHAATSGAAGVHSTGGRPPTWATSCAHRACVALAPRCAGNAVGTRRSTMPASRPATWWRAAVKLRRATREDRLQQRRRRCNGLTSARHDVGSPGGGGEAWPETPFTPAPLPGLVQRAGDRLDRSLEHPAGHGLQPLLIPAHLCAHRS